MNGLDFLFVHMPLFFFFFFWKVFVQKVRSGWVINTYIWDLSGDNFQFVCLLSIRNESLLFGGVLGGGARRAGGRRGSGLSLFFVLKPSSKHMYLAQ